MAEIGLLARLPLYNTRLECCVIALNVISCGYDGKHQDAICLPLIIYDLYMFYPLSQAYIVLVSNNNETQVFVLLSI